MSNASTLTALEFTPAPVTCAWEGCATPATHRVFGSCGCIELTCDPHAFKQALIQHHAETHGETLTCTTCDASGIAVIRMELLA